jgi:DNA repair exonuclease SbcCD ATPase subunit
LRLTTITLTNLRNFEKTEIEGLNDFNLFAGPNGAGKSTILDGLALALSGTCRGAETGRSLGDLRRLGSKRRWAVGLAGQQPGGAGRPVNFTFARTEGQGPKSEQQGQVREFAGVTGAQARACLYSGELLRLSTKDRQRMLLDLMQPVNINVQEDEHLCNLLRRHLDCQKVELSMDDVRNLFDEAYTQRRDAARELKNIGEKPDYPDPPPSLRELRPDQIRAASQKIEKKLLDLHREHDDAKLAVAALKRMPERWQNEIKKQEEIIQKCSRIPDPEKIKARTKEITTKLANTVEARKQLLAKFGPATAAVAKAEADRKIAAEYLEVLKKGGTKECLVCATKLSKAKIAAATERLEQRLRRHKGEVHDANVKLKALRDKEDESKGDVGEIERELATVEHDEQTYIHTSNALKEANEKLTKAQDGLRTAKDPKALQDAEEAVAALGHRIDDGKARAATLTKYLVKTQGVEDVRSLYGKVEREHTELDELVKALGPEGLQKKMAEEDEGSSRFNAGLARIMAVAGFADVDMGPVLQLEGDPIVNGLPARMLSEGQRTLFSLAFQVAIAKYTGVDVVTVDNWEHLDPEAAARGFALAHRAQCQVFLFQVLKDRDRFISMENVPGMSRFLVDNGTVQPVPEEAAA